ncbi:Sec-independent protein translocase protein TatB [Bartonella rochalimae]|uniref:Sec-independent protein translocase protein TatB n=1 Tax=Bartonella rochalimae TaxID=395923 RepID=UPI003F682CA7
MFGIDGSEFLVILLIFIIVVGPKDLPKMLRVIARAIAYMRSTANEFRHHFDDAIKQAELDDLKKILPNTSDLNSKKEFKKSCDSRYNKKGDISGNFNVDTALHKSEKDIEIFEFGTNEVNEDLTVSTSHSHKIIYADFKDKDKENIS